MKNFIDEFKKFISRGNVIDLAIGVVIGGAFQSIVNSLVNDIIMPLIALCTGQVNFTDIVIVMKGTKENPLLTLNIGKFIQAIFNFLIIALAIFVAIKSMNTFKDKLEAKKKKEAVEEVKEPEDSPELKELKKITKLLSAKK